MKATMWTGQEEMKARQKKREAKMEANPEHMDANWKELEVKMETVKKRQRPYHSTMKGHHA
jgi:hypothetical protein